MLKKAWLWSKDSPNTAGIEAAVFKGKKVVIRPKRLDDALDDYSWRTDTELSMLDAARPIRMDYNDFVRFSQEELKHSPANSWKLAIDTLDGKHIGNCMCYDIDLKRGSAELGIMIGDREYWNKGYGTDSVGSLLTLIFSTTSLNRVYLHTLEWNQRARKSFTKAGLREVKIIRRSNLDFVLMEINRQTWEEKHKQDSATPRG